MIYGNGVDILEKDGILCSRDIKLGFKRILSEKFEILFCELMVEYRSSLGFNVVRRWFFDFFFGNGGGFFVRWLVVFILGFFFIF